MDLLVYFIEFATPIVFAVLLFLLLRGVLL